MVSGISLVSRAVTGHDCASLPVLLRSFEKKLSYGTAGFRENADELPMDSVFFRIGVRFSDDCFSILLKGASSFDVERLLPSYFSHVVVY